MAAVDGKGRCACEVYPRSMPALAFANAGMDGTPLSKRA